MAEKTFIIRGFKSEDFDSVNYLWRSTGLGGVERGDYLIFVIRDLNEIDF